MEPPSSYRIAFLNDSGRKLRTGALLAVARDALSRLDFSAGELSIRLTNDGEIRRLNREFRQFDATTDVLTFPPADLPLPARAKRPLGDIVISVDHAQRQADVRGYDLQDELAYLLIHGILHLAGWDDETDADRQAMLAEMAALGRTLNLPELGDWHTLSEAAA